MTNHKQILMVAFDKKIEALRMASGLTLLDDAVRIVAWGGLPDGAEVDEQMEALEFADVPVTRLAGDLEGLAHQILDSDVVYFV